MCYLVLFEAIELKFNTMLIRIQSVTVSVSNSDFFNLSPGLLMRSQVSTPQAHALMAKQLSATTEKGRNVCGSSHATGGY